MGNRRGRRPRTATGDLIEHLEREGHPDVAAYLAASITAHGTREGLRIMGVSYR